MDCLICGAGQADRPAINRNEPHCSEVCRKKLDGELPLWPKDLVSIDRSILGWLVEIGQHAYLRNPGMGEVKSGDDRVIRTFPFQHDKTAKVGAFLRSKNDLHGPVRWHHHDESGISYPLVNATQAGDETTVYRCAECGAERMGNYTNENRDEG